MAQGLPLAFSQRRTNGATTLAAETRRIIIPICSCKQGALQMTYRWMAEIHYNNGEPPGVVAFEELAELHDIVELGPDWNAIDQIVVTLNRPSVAPRQELD
ncbi:hypothetical protein [Bradyrhizobium sp. URHD0069]|uniref:hypothetical protein n=1 Tax=Bradyrhizobium sp. URHD0069 TaxID=1380355 RepID=UPI0012DFA809|nr:hypothetical protein [Bradyrhizobium sp. URHD0069]